VHSSIFFGGSVVAAFVAGAIALFAPCCISVMLPAYFASSAQNRRVLVAMTLLFFAGIASVILPIAMGATVFRRIFSADHTIVYVTGGLIMLGLGAYTLLGGQIHLPMPGRKGGNRAGPLGVYTLGVFSGITSSCCAPVLAGVIALSGLASSFLLSLGLGLAYVFGMVAPLFLISLLWDRYDWKKSRLFRPRRFTWRLGPIRRTISGSNLASGVLLTLMGVGALWVGVSGPSMPSGSGWQAHVSVWLQHWGKVITDALSWIPGWLAAVVLLGIAALLIRKAFRQLAPPKEQETTAGQEQKEEVLERQDT